MNRRIEKKWSEKGLTYVAITMWVVVFALLALVALTASKVRLTSALACSRITNAAVQWVLWRTLARLTRVSFGLIGRAPETWFALFTIVAKRIALAVLAHAAASIVAIDIHWTAFQVHFLDVLAHGRMAVTVALLANIVIFGHARFPLFLHEVRLALLAVRALRIVLTVAFELAKWLMAPVGMAIAYAATADFDFLDWVKVPLLSGGVRLWRHQMGQKCVHFEQTNAHISSADKLLKLFWRGKWLRRINHWRSIIDQRHNHLAVFSRDKVSVLLRANWRGIGQADRCEHAEFVLTGVLSSRKVLPWFPADTVKRLFEHPRFRTRRHGILDRHVGDVKRLLQINGDVDLGVVLVESVLAQWWRHPEVFRVVNYIFNRMAFRRIRILTIAKVAIVEVNVTKPIRNRVTAASGRCSQNGGCFF